MTKKVVFVVVAAAVGVAVVLVLRRDGRPPPVEVGAAAPELSGAAVRGGSVDLRRLRGHIVLLSFLNSRATGSDASNAQVVFLRSMQTQHARFGLRVVVVDAAEASRDELLNYTYDRSLDPPIAVLADDGTRARRFGVEKTPTTFLIGRYGVVRNRWDGFVPAAQLDFALRRIEGRGPTG